MKSTKERLTFSIISFLLSSATILMIPLMPYELEKKRTLAYILAAVFLLGKVMGFMFLRMAGKQWKMDANFTLQVFPQWLTVTSTFLFIFSLEMHGVFKGKNYEFISESIRYGKPYRRQAKSISKTRRL